MKNLKCPECGEGQLNPNVIPLHQTRLGGIPFTVKNAEVTECSRCNRIIVTARELKRWREIQRQQHQESGAVPSPRRIRALRQSLGLSVADLASLLAVTRQSVHAWERDNLGALQIGPAALILQLLERETSGALAGVLIALADEAKSRAQTTPRLLEIAGAKRKVRRAS